MGMFSKEKDAYSSDSEDDAKPAYEPSTTLVPPPVFIGFRQDSVAEKQTVLLFEKHIWRSKESAFEILDQDGNVVALYSGERHAWRVSRSHHELSDPEGNYLFNLKRRNMKTLDTIEATDPQNGDKLLFRVNRKMSMRTSKVDVTIFEPSGGETVMYLRGHFKKGQGIMRIGDEKTGQVVAYSNRDEQSERKYRATIAPGVDLTFMAALWVCIDEALNDTDSNQAAVITVLAST